MCVCVHAEHRPFSKGFRSDTRVVLFSPSESVDLDLFYHFDDPGGDDLFYDDATPLEDAVLDCDDIPRYDDDDVMMTGESPGIPAADGVNQSGDTDKRMWRAIRNA